MKDEEYIYNSECTIWDDGSVEVDVSGVEIDLSKLEIDVPYEIEVNYKRKEESMPTNHPDALKEDNRKWYKVCAIDMSDDQILLDKEDYIIDADTDIERKVLVEIAREFNKVDSENIKITYQLIMSWHKDSKCNCE